MLIINMIQLIQRASITAADIKNFSILIQERSKFHGSRPCMITIRIRTRIRYTGKSDIILAVDCDVIDKAAELDSVEFGHQPVLFPYDVEEPPDC